MIQTARVKHKDVTPEIEFITSRSGGPGGQSVNKVNTKVTLRFSVQQSSILSEEEKQTISEKLASRISNEGILIVSAQNKRTQLQNKEAAFEKFNHLMGKAFTKKRARKATKPTRASKERRLKSKKIQSEKKKMRQGL